ncbi:MAG: hypothetical protein SV429_12360 [Pseudomonadota bacterium]|nr:hypothetical protein [Pseudomonadota bacterium]
MRQISDYFDTCPDQLGTDQLQQYFMYQQEVGELISHTRKLSYQVYFLTTYSLGFPPLSA